MAISVAILNCCMLFLLAVLGPEISVQSPWLNFHWQLDWMFASASVVMTLGAYFEDRLRGVY